MVGERGGLCNRCGSGQWIRVNEREVRCAECGHGATRLSFGFTRQETPPTSAQLQRAAQDARDRAADALRWFDNAAFVPYGLDERWNGLRWFGGWAESNGVVSELELAHGDSRFDFLEPQVRVTRTAATFDDPTIALALAHWTATRSLVNHFWRQTGTLPDEVRRAVFRTDRTERDPTEPWDTAILPIDATAVDFRALSHEDYYVAIATYDDHVVSIQARGWPIEATGIVTIGDLSPYFHGTTEIGRHPGS